jgi:hypothetical protein
VWSPILSEGKLLLLSGAGSLLPAFEQELLHDGLHEREGMVLWCDASHGFNPYDFAEANLAHGHDAEWGSDRVRIKRCMTPFQWDTVLTKHVPARLEEEKDIAFVLAAPYDSLFSTDEIQPWEQEGYVRFSLRLLRALAARHGIPIVLAVDLARWMRSHPDLARMAIQGTDARWVVRPLAYGGWRAQSDTGEVLETRAMRQLALDDFPYVSLVPPSSPSPLAPFRPSRPVASRLPLENPVAGLRFPPSAGRLRALRPRARTRQPLLPFAPDASTLALAEA